MKKLTKVLCVILTSLMLLSVTVPFYGADLLPGCKFTHPVDVSFMGYGTPVIDGSIKDNEGWSTPVEIEEENLVAVTTTVSDYFPTATFSLAWDDDNMYLCADIKDDDFYYSTGVCEEVLYGEPDGTTTIPDNNCGWDGDVFAIEIDPLKMYVEEAGKILGSDMVAWLCFGLFEDGHIGAYVTNHGEKDVTDVVNAAGARTADGWCFEAAMPWELISEMVDNSSFNKCTFDKDAFTADLSESSGCIYICDRRYDSELDEVTYNNIFATASSQTLVGLSSLAYPYPCVAIEGLRIVAVGKDGDSSEYVPYVEPTTLKWENKFTDVIEDQWYYNAVAKACDKGWFAGLSETTFAPSNTLTRAMFVTTLARVARTELGEAKGDMFKDVPAGKWYSAPVEWAASTGITGGTGDGYFSPDASVTRQQIAQFLYKLAAYKNYRTDGVDENALENFPDKADTAAWAVEAVTWAVSNGLISGVKEADKTLLYPAANTTRSQCAQMLIAFDKKDFSHMAKDDEYAKMTICGNDISEYVIVYGSGSYDYKAATELAKYIELTTGITLKVVKDTGSEPQEKEILVGEKTNREDGWFDVDRSEVTIEGYTIITHDNKLLISGGRDHGTLYGVYGFLRDYIGWIFAYGDCESRLYKAEIALDDGICDVENSILDYTCWFSVRNTGDWEYKTGIRVGHRTEADEAIQCSIPWMLHGGTWENHMGKNPCYSDPEMIERITNLTLQRMRSRPQQRNFCLGMNDSSYYCMCDRCVQIYREEKSRTGVYVRLANHVMEEVKKEFPDNRLICFGYNFSVEAPVSDFHEGIILRYITITACMNHPLTEKKCPMNTFLYNNLVAYKDKCSTLWLADDTGYTSSYNLDFYYKNIQLYNELGSTGYVCWNLGNADDDEGAKAGVSIENMVLYLMNYHYWKTDVTRDQYYILSEEYLEAYYGAGWRDIREYIDLLAKMQSLRCYGWHSGLSDSFSEAIYKDTHDEVVALYQAAYDKAQDDGFKSNVDELYYTYKRLEDVYGY